MLGILRYRKLFYRICSTVTSYCLFHAKGTLEQKQERLWLLETPSNLVVAAKAFKSTCGCYWKTNWVYVTGLRGGLLEKWWGDFTWRIYFFSILFFYSGNRNTFFFKLIHSAHISERNFFWTYASKDFFRIFSWEYFFLLCFC